MSVLRNLLRRFQRFEPDISEIDDHTLSDIGLTRIGIPMGIEVAERQAELQALERHVVEVATPVPTD